MKNLLHRHYNKNNKKGFTLAELLVVVAIVGILVAISVPLFTAQLGKARQATNNANLRAAKIAAVSQYLTDTGKDVPDGTLSVKYKYNIASGVAERYTENIPATTNVVTINDADVSKTTVYKDIYVTVSGTANNNATVVMNAE